MPKSITLQCKSGTSHGAEQIAQASNHSSARGIELEDTLDGVFLFGYIPAGHLLALVCLRFTHFIDDESHKTSLMWLE